MYPGSHVEKLASLPTRDQALAMLMGVMLAADHQAGAYGWPNPPPKRRVRWLRYATRRLLDPALEQLRTHFLIWHF